VAYRIAYQRIKGDSEMPDAMKLQTILNNAIHLLLGAQCVAEELSLGQPEA
jgi:hypothetical protein